MKKPAHEVMVDKIKLTCRIQEISKPLGKVGYEMLYFSANFAIAALCDALGEMIIPIDKISWVITELETVAHQHVVIRNLVSELRASEVFLTY